ncbi:MAG: histidinol-phosphatase HisJ family protein [Clostridia bacterium]|nr:histidinol-phosphatase HisJ family protein [Clostridia bacterium]
MSNILCDMHVHSQSSHDSKAPVAQTAQECLKKGISVLAITDHCDIQLCKEQNVLELVKRSIAETEQTANEFEGRVKILKGVEIGEGIWNLDYTENILNSFNFDVVIGSVHGVRYEGYCDSYSTIDFSKMSKEQLNSYMALYFDEVLEMLNTTSCDIMAHLTCPLRYINGKYGLGVDSLNYKAQIEKILDLVIEKSIAMEINTSGIGSFYGQLMPEPWIIKRFREKGGYLITLGSDAHTPENVGNGFDKAIELLKSYKFDSYYYYENRKAVKCPIA